MRDLLLVTIVLIISAIALVKPKVGILAYVCFAYLNPNAYTFTFARNFPIAEIPAITTILGFLFGSEPKSIPFQRESKLLLGLWLIFGLSTLFAIRQQDAWDYYLRISKIFLMTFLLTAIIKDKEQLIWVVRVIAFPVGLLGLKGGLWAIRTGGGFTVGGPADTWLEANNSIGLVLAMNVPLLHFLGTIETIRWRRHIIRAMMFLSYPAAVCSYSRGAWIGLAVVTALMVLRTRRKFIVVSALAILIMLILPLLPHELETRYDTLQNYEEDGSAQSRFWNWEFCLRVALSRPITGGGFSMYSLEAYHAYFPDFLVRFPGKVWSAHSIWFSVLGEHGFLGLTIWICLIASCFISLQNLCTLGRKESALSWLTPFAAAIQTSLVAFVISGSFLDASYFEIFYHLLAIVIVLKVVLQKEVTQSPNNPGLTKFEKSKTTTRNKVLEYSKQ